MIPPVTERSGRHAVHALNFFVAAMQTGFGPFLSVWLVSQGWSLTEVGVALSIGTVAALCGQIPGGGLVDRIHHKRDITAIALGVIAVSALMIALTPTVHAVWAAQVLHAVGSVVVTPAIAALTLALCGHDSFSERLGGNARYASIGAALAAGGFGLASTHLGERSIFLITAALALPAIASLFAIRPGQSQSTTVDHMAMARVAGRRKVLLIGFLALPARALLFALDPGPWAVDVIQVLDGVSATVLGLMLPLIAADVTRRTGHLNLAIGSFGLAAGLGATFSTTVAGWVADRMGEQMAFLGLALVGMVATALLTLAMPETRPVGDMEAVEAAA